MNSSPGGNTKRLVRFAKALQVLRRPSESQKALIEAKKNVQEMTDHEERARMWVEISEALFAIELVPQSREAAEAARHSGKLIVIDSARSMTVAQVAVAFAQLGDYRAARLAAESCAFSNDRLRAYGGILHRYRVR